MRKGFKLIGAMLAMTMIMSTALCGCGNKQKQANNGGGSTTDVPLKIAIVKKGYGDEFAYKLAEAFEAKTGIETVVDRSSSADAWVETAMKSGKKNNDYDVIFDINEKFMKNVATNNFAAGYERAYVDLSDIYNSKLEGYDTDKTLKELVYAYSLDSCTWGGDEEGYGDGKQYAVNWASGIEGLVYNVALFEKYKLSVPNTTDELLALMEQMKTLKGGSYAKNDDGYTTYPFVYAGQNDYTKYLATVWWAQYDGIDSFNNILHGKDAQGVYTANSTKSAGKLSAYKLVGEVIGADKDFCSEECTGLSFTDAQVLFLDEQAFMMSTGDWLEREMEANFSNEMKIAFMKMPVNSNIIDNCDTVKTDAQLSEVVSYIDGVITEKPSYVSDSDLAYIKSARSMYMNEGGQHVAYIPAYSDNIDAAKQFLQFMLSKEGQEIMLEYSYGNMAPLNVDVTSFKQYEKLSYFQKSKMELFNVDGGATLVGLKYVHPMNYGGALTLYSTYLECLGKEKNLDTYKSPMELWTSEYNAWAKKWDNMMDQAGVSN